jgi:hypothetical protein
MSDLVYLIPITTIAGLWVYMIIRSLARAKVRELEIRERIAMIEKGHIPAPEVNPSGFERAMARREARFYYGGASRHRRVGTILIGLGLGLMLMISFAGDDPQTGLGVGGFLVMIGLAFVANGLIEQRRMPDGAHGAGGGPAPSAIDAPKVE